VQVPSGAAPHPPDTQSNGAVACRHGCWQNSDAVEPDVSSSWARRRQIAAGQDFGSLRTEVSLLHLATDDGNRNPDLVVTVHPSSILRGAPERRDQALSGLADDCDSPQTCSTPLAESASLLAALRTGLTSGCRRLSLEVGECLAGASNFGFEGRDLGSLLGTRLFDDLVDRGGEVSCSSLAARETAAARPRGREPGRWCPA